MQPRLAAAGATVAAIVVAWATGPSAPDRYLGGGCPDCEAIGRGVLAQPTLAVTSLVFVALGAWVLDDRRIETRARLLFGVAAVAVGLGSFLGHSNPTGATRTLDAVTVKLLVLAFLTVGFARWHRTGTQRLVPAWLAMGGAVAAIEVWWPAAGNPLLGMLVAAAVVITWVSVEPGGRQLLLGALTAMSLGALAWWLGRAESSLCSPQSWLQIHGAWHILAATGIAMAYAAHRNEVA